MKLNRKIRSDNKVFEGAFVEIPSSCDITEKSLVLNPIEKTLKQFCSYHSKRYLGMKYLGIKDNRHVFQAVTD